MRVVRTAADAAKFLAVCFAAGLILGAACRMLNVTLSRSTMAVVAGGLFALVMLRRRRLSL